MADPSKLSSSSIFDAFKNNDYKTASLSISGNLAQTAFITFTGTTTLDRAESVTQIYFTTSANSEFHSTGRNYLYTSDTLISHFNGGNSYQIQFSVEYSGTTLSLKANIQNQNPGPITLVNETISFEVYTFIAPFTG